MLDPHKQARWFREFLEAAMKFPHAHASEAAAQAWAKSMSLIAEQVIDTDDEPEPATTA
jgi:hypothetical protein